MVLRLGIDLGGTYARAAVVDAEGRVLAADKRPHRDTTPQGVAESLGEVAAAALAGVPGAQVDRVGIGIAGQLQGKTGLVRVAPNLGWRDVPLGDMAASRLGRPVRVVNDLSAAAFGELRAGAGRGASEVLVVFVGSGVGSAIITGGRLLEGSTGVAGEFGHLKVQPGGRQCGCGERGCLEAYVGGHKLLEQLQEALAAKRNSRLNVLAEQAGDHLTTEILEHASLEGDPVAHAIYERAGAMLGLAVANQITMLNPERLIIGGGTLAHLPGLKQHLIRGVRAYASLVSNEAVTIRDAELGDDSGLIGAALLAD